MKQTMKKLTAVLLIFAMCVSVVTPVSAATKKLTTKEKKAYSSVLWSGGAENFLFYDVNNDGRKELLLSYSDTASGIHTRVDSINGNKVFDASLRGVIVNVSEKGVEVFLDKPSNSRERREEYTVYSINKKGIASLKLKYIFVKNLSTGAENSTYYNAESEEITEDNYKKQYKKYNFKEVGKTIKPYTLSKKNIIKLVGTSASLKLSDGIYNNSHVGEEFSRGSWGEDIYKAYIKKGKNGKSDKLVLYGNCEEYGYGVGTYTITLSSTCKFYLGTKKSSSAVFNKNFDNTKNVGTFHFCVKNGKVTDITMDM